MVQYSKQSVQSLINRLNELSKKHYLLVKNESGRYAIIPESEINTIEEQAFTNKVIPYGSLRECYHSVNAILLYRQQEHEPIYFNMDYSYTEEEFKDQLKQEIGENDFKHLTEDDIFNIRNSIVNNMNHSNNYENIHCAINHFAEEYLDKSRNE